MVGGVIQEETTPVRTEMLHHVTSQKNSVMICGDLYFPYEDQVEPNNASKINKCPYSVTGSAVSPLFARILGSWKIMTLCSRLRC